MNLYMDASPEKHVLRNRKERRNMLNAIEKGDMNLLFMCLTPKMRAFCHEFLVDLKPKDAAIRAGYAPKYANRQAYLLKFHRGVQTYIGHLQMSKEAMINAVDPDYVISRVREIVESSQKDADKLRGLELLARHLGMFTEKHEISGPGGEAIKMQQETQQNAADFARSIAGLASRGGTGSNLITATPRDAGSP